MKPYIICHMIESVDGRIDCAMTEKIDDTNHYYETLDSLECDATIEGKTTLVMHYAEKGMFYGHAPYVRAGQQVYRACDSQSWAVGVDTRGTLNWSDDVKEKFGRPLIMLLSEKASQEYLDYLRSKGISFITVGEKAIDMPQAVELLNTEFGVQRLAVVGGGHLNGSFLQDGLIDEISMLYGAGIDAREGMASSFDGREKNSEPIRLKLQFVRQLDDIIWAKYTLQK